MHIVGTVAGSIKGKLKGAATECREGPHEAALPSQEDPAPGPHLGREPSVFHRIDRNCLGSQPRDPVRTGPGGSQSRPRWGAMSAPLLKQNHSSSQFIIAYGKPHEINAAGSPSSCPVSACPGCAMETSWARLIHQSADEPTAWIVDIEHHAQVTQFRWNPVHDERCGV